MGKIKGWRRTFDSPDNTTYKSTEELYTPEADEIMPEGTSIAIQKRYDAPGWMSLSEPEGYTIDDIVFMSKRSGLDTIVEWMKDTKPVHTAGKTSKVSTMKIYLDPYRYLSTVYLEGGDNEAEGFVESVFVRGWKGVKKEFPTLDTLEWGFLTSEMFHDENEMIKLSKFLDVPIVDRAIELSAPETDPGRVALEKKVKIIWR